MDAPTVALVPWPQVPLPLAGARECQGEKPTQERGNLAWGGVGQGTGGLGYGFAITLFQSSEGHGQRNVFKKI